MKRPLGLTLVATTAIVLGITQILVSFGYFGLSALEFLEVSWLRGDMTAISYGLTMAMGVALALIGVAGIVFGIGAARMRTWAWPLGVGTYLLGIAGSVLMLFATQTSLTAGITGILSAVLAWYLSTVDVREAFGQEAGVAGGHRPHAV